MKKKITLTTILMLLLAWSAQSQVAFWGAGSNYGTAHGEFRDTFIRSTSSSNIATNQWTAVTIFDGNGTGASSAAYWKQTLLGYSQGAYWGDTTPLSSSTPFNGAAIFDSDFMDNGGIPGAFATGTSPSPHRGELISPRIDMTGLRDSAVSVAFYMHHRTFQTDTLTVSMSVDDGATWVEADISYLIPTVNSMYDSWVLVPFWTVTAGVSNLTQCRIKITHDGDYYFTIIDDLTLVNGTTLPPYPCPLPDVSIVAPFLRPGFSNQYVTVQACNNIFSGDTIYNSYVDIELDSLLTLQYTDSTYTSLGNNTFRFQTGDLAPGQCANIVLACSLSVNAILGQTLCMQASLYPIDSCALDTLPNSSSGVAACSTAWDESSLQVLAQCENDSACFVISNVGGDMSCYSAVRIYRDGLFIELDSVLLMSGDTAQFKFDAEGYTWRLEVDQHPLHPGNSLPNGTVELCGDSTTTNFSLGFWNAFPQNDADRYLDIFCGMVRGSYDPNDKTGIPNGIGPNHDILPGQSLQYLIRFQNTGTDTAFNVVITDTLAATLDINSVISGASSDNYSFQIKPGRVLEWTFSNIMLPDSNVNEPASHGFVYFSVDQAPNLPLGTRIENSAAIYFDFNAPIITNTYFHTLNNYQAPATILVVQSIDVEELDIQLYPNPNQGLFYLAQKGEEELEITITDNLGRILLVKQSNDQLTEVDVNAFPTGVYYVNLKSGNKSITHKIVKQ